MPDELERILKLSKLIEFQSEGRVFNQVKVYDKNGKLVKIVPSEDLESKYWHNFLKDEKKTLRMGEESLAIIENYSPRKCAEGFLKVIETAIV